MIEIRRTQAFREWLSNLRDKQARAHVLRRIDRLAAGNPGNSRGVGHGVIELKIDYGPGYRVYYVSRGNVVAVLLCGGDKSSQGKDIAKAKDLALNLAWEAPSQ